MAMPLEHSPHFRRASQLWSQEIFSRAIEEFERMSFGGMGLLMIGFHRVYEHEDGDYVWAVSRRWWRDFTDYSGLRLGKVVSH